MQNTTKYSVASWDTTKKCHVTKQKKITHKNINEH